MIKFMDFVNYDDKVWRVASSFKHGDEHFLRIYEHKKDYPTTLTVLAEAVTLWKPVNYFQGVLYASNHCWHDQVEEWHGGYTHGDYVLRTGGFTNGIELRYNSELLLNIYYDTPFSFGEAAELFDTAVRLHERK